MFADLDYSCIEFDPAFLEALLWTLAAVGGVVILYSKLTGSPSPFSSPPGDAYQHSRKMLSGAAAAEPAPAGGEEGGSAAQANHPPPVSQERSQRLRKPTDRRRALRRQGKPVRVLVSDPAGGEEPLVCWVVNRSRGGLGLVAPRPLAVGSLFGVRAAHAPDDVEPSQVQVRNCRRKGRRWLVGCRFTEDLPWRILLLFG